MFSCGILPVAAVPAVPTRSHLIRQVGCVGGRAAQGFWVAGGKWLPAECSGTQALLLQCSSDFPLKGAPTSMSESHVWLHGQPSHTAAKGDRALASAGWLNCHQSFPARLLQWRALPCPLTPEHPTVPGASSDLPELGALLNHVNSKWGPGRDPRLHHSHNSSSLQRRQPGVNSGGWRSDPPSRAGGRVTATL